MSNYSLMVKISYGIRSNGILDTVASLMLPYKSATGDDSSKKYLKFYDVEKDFLESYRNDVFSGKWLEIEHPDKNGKRPCEVWNTFESYMEDWIGYKHRDLEKQRFGYWENPNGKWSSYEISTWFGKQSFHLRSGEVADIAKICDIDWKVMSQQVDENITNFWLRYQRYNEGKIKGSYDIEMTLGKLGLRKFKKDSERISTILKTEDIIDEPPEIETIPFTLNDLRTKYRWWWDFGTFAVLDKNGWNQQGQMYMLGMSDETEEERKEWGRTFFNKWIKDEDPNSWLVIVHCIA